MEPRSSQIKKKQVGLFKTIDLKIKPNSVEKFVFEVQKNNSVSISADIFEEVQNIEDIQVWNVNDSKVDISVNKLQVSSLKKIFLVSPIAIMRIALKSKTPDTKGKIINMLVKDLFIIRKLKSEPIYIRFSSEFKTISNKELLEKYKFALSNENSEYFEKNQVDKKTVIYNEQKRKVNEKYNFIKKYYKMTDDKEYEINIFNKIDYHISRISVLEEFLYNELIKVMLFDEALPLIDGRNDE